MVGEESWEEEVQQVRLARKRWNWYKTFSNKKTKGSRVGREAKEFVEEYSSGRELDKEDQERKIEAGMSDEDGAA